MRVIYGLRTIADDPRQQAFFQRPAKLNRRYAAESLRHLRRDPADRANTPRRNDSGVASLMANPTLTL